MEEAKYACEIIQQAIDRYRSGKGTIGSNFNLKQMEWAVQVLHHTTKNHEELLQASKKMLRVLENNGLGNNDAGAFARYAIHKANMKEYAA